MNVLPSPTTQEAVSRVPRRSLEQVSAVRALDNTGERSSRQPPPRASLAEHEDVIERLERGVEPDPRLPLRGRRAVAAYNALSQAEDQAYMRQVLGFELRI